MTRTVTFIRAFGLRGREHALVTLEDGEDASEAIDVLMERWPNQWGDFSTDDEPCRLALIDAKITKFDFPPLEGAQFSVEPAIPHNWGIGDADLLDHLDSETRALVVEAIALQDFAIDETLYGAI